MSFQKLVSIFQVVVLTACALPTSAVPPPPGNPKIVELKEQPKLAIEQDDPPRDALRYGPGTAFEKT